MLYDLFASLPDASEIVNYVRQVMGDEHKKTTLVCDFSPRLMIGSLNAKGISDLETRFDLTVVKSKFPFSLSSLDEIAYQSVSSELEWAILDDVSIAGSLRLDAATTGTIGEDDVLFLGSPLQSWTLQGTEGDNVAIALSSEQFDTLLYVDGPGLLTPLANDDREKDDTNSLICLALPETGTYRVFAGAFDSATPGDRYLLQASVTDAGAVCDDFERL